MTKQSLTIIGNGSWGLALAGLANRNSGAIIWGRSRKGLENEVQDLQKACKNKHFVMALPCHALPDICQAMQKWVAEDSVFISAAKGMAEEAGLPSKIIKNAFPKGKIAVLAGPNFASEVVRDLPAAAVVAGDSQAIAVAMDMLAGRHFRLYQNASMEAVELCAVMKNIIAIACGISAGLALGENAKAALMTRGLAEMHRLIEKICKNEKNADEAISGLAGIGDLSLTCSSLQSRNMAFGFALGQGSSQSQAQQASSGICEGVRATPAIMALAQQYQVDLPIISCVNDILYNGKILTDAIGDLLNRPLSYS